MNRIKGIAFDLEGTILPTDTARHSAWLALAKELGVPITFDQALAQIPGWIGGGDRVIAQWLTDTSGRSVDELLARDLELFESLLTRTELTPRPGFLEFLEQVKQASLPFALGSLTPREQGETLLQLSGLDTAWPREMIVFLEDVPHKKPAPDVYLETAKRMDIDPTDQIVFEDSPTGVTAALAAGSIPIAVPFYPNNPKVTASLQSAGAHKIFKTWQEVTITNL